MVWLSLLLPLLATEPAPVTFEDLGQPVRQRELTPEFVTRDAAGAWTAWAVQEDPEHVGLAGIRVATGEVVRAETLPYGRSHVRVAQAPNGDLVCYAGNPAHFLRLEAATGKLVDLGCPAKPASYFLGDAVAGDWFYVGSYPATWLVRCNLRTGAVESLGRIADDPKESYLIQTAVSDDEVVYCAVGLHHRELWALDLRTRGKRQILPEAMTRAQGNPRVWTGTDGQVYGLAGTTRFRCRRDGIDEGQTCAERPRTRTLDAGDVRVGPVDAEGRLRLTHLKTKQVAHRPTAWPGSPREIFSVSCERDGVVYGGTFSPAISFAVDTRTGKTTDLGRLSTAPIQVYDTLSTPGGLFLASYMNASVDFLDPAAPRQAQANPRPVITVAGQERPQQLCLGPDGRVYTGTVPAKGRLGGALVRVDPKDFSTKVWTDLVPNQSLWNLAAVPETGEVVVTTSITGGSSSIATEKEALVFGWDPTREAIAWRAQPVPGTKSYGAVVHACNGLLYGLAETRYYAFDPKTHQVVFTADLPVSGTHFPGLSRDPVGPRGLIYGLGEDAIFAIDPADQQAKVVLRDPSLKQAHGFYVTADGTLYVGVGATLKRVRLPR